MKKQTSNNNAPAKKADTKKTHSTSNSVQEARKAARTIDTANKDKHDADRKSGM